MNIEKALSYAAEVTKRSIPDFADGFPDDQSTNYVYKSTENTSWTEGFYPGILWLLYEMTGDEAFRRAAENHYPSMKTRIYERINTAHHDMGFLYSLSCVAQYKLTGDTDAKATALTAADCLIERYHEKGGFIQAWGPLDQQDSYRLIVDCLLNIPLLFWATEVTNNQKYRQIAETHLHTALDTVIRDDYSSYHTYYFDINTGAPLKGTTHQGYADDSCWARGQAWAVCGIPLAYHYTKDESLLEKFNGVTEYFISHLPEDYVPYWDLCFSPEDHQPRDTSAAAIAVCGILEMEKHFPNPKFRQAAENMMNSLAENYTTKNYPNSNGILTDGMYNRNGGDNPECNIWGDYFYLEALMRMKNPDWKLYW